MAVLLFVCVFVGGHRGVFVVVWGSQASPMPLWSVSVWSWLAMVGQLSCVSGTPSPSRVTWIGKVSVTGAGGIGDAQMCLVCSDSGEGAGDLRCSTIDFVVSVTV